MLAENVCEVSGNSTSTKDIVLALRLHASTDEALIVTHHQLGFELFHCVQYHRDHDQQRRAAKGESIGGGEGTGEKRHGGDDGQE